MNFYERLGHPVLPTAHVVDDYDKFTLSSPW